MGLRIAIGSKKGGTGVSMLARNMAVFLAQVGKRTALADMSGSVAGVEAFAGMDEGTVSREGLSSLHLRGVLQNLEVFFATADPLELFDELNDRLERGEFEVLVVDVKMDGSEMASKLMRSCPLRLLVTTPEPISVYELYACAASIVEDELAKTLPGGSGPEVFRSQSNRDDWLAGFLSPADMMQMAGADEIGDRIIETVRNTRIGFIVNMATEREDFELPRAIESVATRLFCLPLVDMGTVERDDALGAALRRRIPLLIHMPYSKGGRDIEAIARRLLSTPNVDHVRPRLELLTPHQLESHYEALEVDRGAGEHEIRKATRRIREVFGGQTHATVELTRPERLERILERASEAHGILLDRKAKREYDRRLIREEGSSSFFVRPFGERPASPVVATVKTQDSPPEPVPEEGVSGSWLMTMRERRGMTLDELSDISKVSVTYLHALELEQFDALPEPVYVRGFLVAYARTLNLDAAAVAGQYLEMMNR